MSAAWACHAMQMQMQTRNANPMQASPSETTYANVQVGGKNGERQRTGMNGEPCLP